MKDEVIQRKGCSQADNSTNRDSTKRTVPQGLRNFLEWDEKVTQMVVNFIQSQLPNVTKSETKFMEVSCSGFIWIPVCLIFFFLHPLVPKQLSVNLLIAFFLDILIVGLLKAFARRRRPSTSKADYFKSIGPDRYSFPSGHASRSILIAGIFTEIYPLFDYGSIVYLISSVIIWIWAFSVCISRLINGRHYLLDVVSGISIGFSEVYIVSKLWLSSQVAENMFNVLFDDIPEI